MPDSPHLVEREPVKLTEPQQRLLRSLIDDWRPGESLPSVTRASLLGHGLIMRKTRYAACGAEAGYDYRITDAGRGVLADGS